MDNDTREAIKFITSLRTIDNYVLLSQKEVIARNTKLNDIAFMIDEREKYKKILDELEDLMQDPSIINELKAKYLGLKPKSKRERLTDIIQAVYNSYVHRNQVHDKERDGIIKLLVDLRDEEEDV